MKIHIFSDGHHKNMHGLNLLINHNNWVKVNNINDADIIFSFSKPIDIENYPNKKFIFGNQFSTFPDNKVRNINNKYNNAIYIQPSEWVNNFWDSKNVKNIPIKVLPFPVDFEKFKPLNVNKTNDIILYTKRRNPNVINFVKSKLSNYKIINFDYEKKYQENNYIDQLNKSKFIIWVGCHESQGFALLEALSMNVPIFVCDVNRLKEELGQERTFMNEEVDATTAEYFDDTCGIKIKDLNDFDSKFNEFLSNLNSYQPRQYIINNLTAKKITENYLGTNCEKIFKC
jgi:glycosyltransferase involved in cell wall biosynthesis